MRTASGRRMDRAGLFVLLGLLLCSAGCSATKITGLWKDDAYQRGRLRNVLVIAAAKTPTVRRSCESEFVRLLKNRGVAATESFNLLPDETMEDSRGRDSILAKMKELGIDAVLMTRSIGMRKASESIPGVNVYAVHAAAPFSSYGAWNSYYGVAVTFPPAPSSVEGVTYERTYVVMETSLYDVKTEKTVWSAQSETLVSRVPEEEIKPYIGLVVGKLFDARLF